MKKLLLLLLLFPFVLGSCSKLNDDEKFLNDTTWELSVDGDGYTQTWTFSFSESTYKVFGCVKYDKGGWCETMRQGTYTYDHPDITFVEYGDTYTGKISGNEMTVRGSTSAYIKK